MLTYAIIIMMFKGVIVKAVFGFVGACAFAGYCTAVTLPRIPAERREWFGEQLALIAGIATAVTALLLCNGILGRIVGAIYFGFWGAVPGFAIMGMTEDEQETEEGKTATTPLAKEKEDREELPTPAEVADMMRKRSTPQPPGIEEHTEIRPESAKGGKVFRELSTHNQKNRIV